MFKKIIPVALLALLVSGCNDSEETKDTKKVEETEVEEKQAEETSSEEKRVDLSVIDQVVIPSTLEEWKNAETGLFVLDYTLEHETSSWPQEARDLSAEEKKELRECNSGNR